MNNINYVRQLNAVNYDVGYNYWPVFVQDTTPAFVQDCSPKWWDVQDCTDPFVQDCSPKWWDVQDCTDPFVQSVKYIYVKNNGLGI